MRVGEMRLTFKMPFFEVQRPYFYEFYIKVWGTSNYLLLGTRTHTTRFFRQNWSPKPTLLAIRKITKRELKKIKLNKICERFSVL